jgi:recombination protein RecA
MAVPARRVIAKGAGKPAPSAPVEPAPKTGGIKRRTSIPVTTEYDAVPDLPGEVGDIIKKMSDSGHYGRPFILGSQRRMDTGRRRSGVLALDLCLGGGFTKARANMIYGEKSSGKTTTIIKSIATMMRNDPEAMAAWIDVEGTFDMKWAIKHGVDPDRLVVVEPETGEHAVDLADAMLRAREIEWVVTDSIAMLIPMRELDESAEQETMALQARLVGKYIRKTNNALIKEKARGHMPLLTHINQFRMKVGLIFGDPRTLPGGKALEFSTTQQIEIKAAEHKGKDEDGNEVVVFNEHNVKITKNKGGGPMKEAMFKLIRLKDFEDKPEAWVDQCNTIFKFGQQARLITGTAGQFEVYDEGKFKGNPAFSRWALAEPDRYNRLQDRIIEHFRKRWDL